MSEIPHMLEKDWMRFSRHIGPIDPRGCRHWTASLSVRGGYGQFKLRGRLLTAHRLSLLRETGLWPSNLLACHRCNTPSCVNPSHLYWGSHKENHRDCVLAGNSYVPISLPGEGCHLSKLSEKNVLDAISRSNGGESAASIARSLNVSDTAILSILSGKTWKHLKI